MNRNNREGYKMIRYQKLGFVLLFICLGSVQAQRPALDFFTAVKGDSVFLYLNQTPRIGQGFIVERRGPEDTDFERLTPTPIMPVLDAGQARRILGDYYEDLVFALKMDSKEGLLVKLRTDPYYGQIAMLMDRRAARILGRYFPAGNHMPEATYGYRITLVDRAGKPVGSAEHEIVIRENVPEPVPSFSCRQEKNVALLEWEYPEWSGDMTDLTFQFMLFRSDDRGAFQRIHEHPLLRLEGFPLQFTDKDIQPNHVYAYRMVAVNACGLLSDPVEIVLNTRDLIPPARPDGLVTEERRNGIALTWNPSLESDVVGYHVWRWKAEETDSVQINDSLIPAGQTLYVDTSTVFGTGYFYAVSAVDEAGNQSPHSNRMDGLITDKIPPRPPRSLSASLVDHTVYLSWSPSPDPDVAGYEIRRGYDEETAYKLQEQWIADTSFTDDGTQGSSWIPGGRYYYSVVAVDTMTYKSTPVGAWMTIPDDEPPHAPGRVLAENHLGREIRIRWNPSVSGDVSLYRVMRIAYGDTTQLDVFGISDRHYTDAALEKGSTASYGVAAVDTAGNISEISVSDPVTLRDFHPPTTSAHVTAALSEKGVQIRWEPVGDFDLAGYNVYRGDLPTSVGKRLNSDPIAETEWIDNEGKNGHWYWVRSVDTSGNESGNSETVNVR